MEALTFPEDFSVSILNFSAMPAVIPAAPGFPNHVVFWQLNQETSSPRDTFVLILKATSA